MRCLPITCQFATEALANVPTRSTKALLTLASQNTEILKSRKLAAEAFGKHVNKTACC